MELKVLGCSGGIGAERRTTSFLLGDEILIDAGSGVMELSLEQMARIRHIFVTHSHLDHIHAIPLLVDSIFDKIDQPVLIHALPQTIDALRAHIFNWTIWPDFGELPSHDCPVIRFEPMYPGEIFTQGELKLEMVPVEHIVPTVGFIIETPNRVAAFSGDTTTNEGLWRALNARERLDLLIVEAAFSNAEVELCRQAKHYCPGMLADDLEKLRHDPPIYLTHAKPGSEAQILNECRELIPQRSVAQLSGGEVFSL